MRLSEIQKCVCCNKGLMHNNSLTWHKLEVTSEFADLRAIQRVHGPEQMMNGHVGIARVLGVDEEVGAEVAKATAYICFDCHLKYSLAVILEHIPEDAWKEGSAAKEARERLEAGR